MKRITSSYRMIYQCLERFGGGVMSYGTLAIMTGCHRNTVRNAVMTLAAYGLLSVDSCGRGRPNVYRLTAK